jgi:hypothetical protein
MGELDKTLDPAIPGVVEMCRGFAPTIGPFKLIHDHSKVIESAKADLLIHDKISDPADPTRTNVSVGVKEIGFGDSKHHAQLQIADWAAGFSKDIAMAQWGFANGTVNPEELELAEAWLAGGPLALDLGLLEQPGGGSS